MMRVLLFLLLLVATQAFAVCQQTGFLVQADIPPTGAATFYLQPNDKSRVAYSYTTDNERLIGVLSEKTVGAVGMRVTLIGDVSVCPGAGPLRPAGNITRAITGE